MAIKRLLWAVIGAASVWGCVQAGPSPDRIAAPSFAAEGVGRPSVLVNPKADDNGTAKTVQEGIDLVANGGTVLVVPGTYEERIIIDKGLTLQGLADGSGAAVIRHSQETSAPATQAVILIETPNPVAIRDVTVHHDNIRGLNALRDVDLTIERTSFEGVSTNIPVVGNGVSVVYGAGTSGKRARAVIRDSRFVMGGIGVAIGGDVDALIEHNEIRSSGTRVACLNVSPTGQGGTMLPSPGIETNVDIVNNVIEDCGVNQAGRFNSVVINGTPGAATTGTVNVIGNAFRNTSPTECPASAIAYAHYVGVIEHNTIIDVVKEHCAATNAPGNFPGAIFVGSRIPGIRAADVAVRFNDIAGNDHAGLRIGANQPDPIVATCNWWGSASGPSGIGTGDGDAVVVEAGAAAPVFIPFATSPIARTAETTCAGGASGPIP
jgi:hypothetical protein